MTFPARRLLPLCLLLLVATSKCSCLTATSSTGTCEGRVGGLDVTGAVDPESEHHTEYPTTSRADRTVLTLSCAQGRFKVRGIMSRVTAFGEKFSLTPDAGCPLPGSDGGTSDAGTSDAGTSDAGTSDGGSGGCTPGAPSSDTYPVYEWQVLTPAAGLVPAIATGIISATLKLDESLDGTAKMEFVDGTALTIRYNAYHEDSLDVGSPPSSGGSGDSDSD